MDAKEILRDDISDFASGLEAMTIDEVFNAMGVLEKHSEDNVSERDETLYRIALVEQEIERRFPGQKLAPFRDWKQDRTLLS
jgi:hypothetical protein